MIHSKATSIGGLAQKNSLVRNSQLINSSIIINVIVKDKDGMDEVFKLFMPTEAATVANDYDETTTETEQVYQKPDIGLLKIGNEFGDRYVRPYEPLIRPAEPTTEASN
jgi:hypothetical protein